MIQEDIQHVTLASTHAYLGNCTCTHRYGEKGGEGMREGEREKERGREEKIENVNLTG